MKRFEILWCPTLRLIKERAGIMKEKEQQPNILFVCSDQYRADVLGCAGNNVVATPNLDRLANEGTRFDQAWVESPICQPALH
ncbi:MAG: arylsulfatase A-like enzyme [Candidatus Azotimanducaceae bacterium]